VATQDELETILGRQAQGPTTDDGRFNLATALAAAGYASKLSGLILSNSSVLSLSLCTITPDSGRRRNHAMRNASVTSSAFMCGCIDKPTTCRLNRSMMTARYTQPSAVAR